MAKKEDENNNNEKKGPVEQEFRFSGAPYRLEGESYEEYKARRKAVNAIDKRRLKGKVLWHSKVLGSYKKQFKGHEEEIYKQLEEYVQNQNNKLDTNNKSTKSED